MQTTIQKPRLLALLLLTLSLIMPVRLSAQVARLYSNKHGLKTSSCSSVDIDSHGFVWVSGYSTLGMFDGTKFQYLSSTDKDGKELFQRAYGVKETGEGYYLVCTSQGLYRFNSRTSELSLVSTANDSTALRYGNAANAIIDYPKKDHVLVTTDGFKVHVLNTKTLEEDSKLASKINDIVLDGFVTQPLIDRKHRLWVTTNSTPLVCVDLNAMKGMHIDYTPEAQRILSGSSVTRLLETGRGIFVGTTHGLLIYEDKTRTVRTIDLPNNDMCVRSIIKTRDNKVLIGTDGRGLWQLLKDGDNLTLIPYTRQASGVDISYGKVMDMTEDNNGNVIAVFLQKGLVVIPPQNDCFHYHPISPLENGQNATCVTSMEIDEQQNYWVATDGCGVFTTDGMRLATARPVNEGLRSMLVQDIKIDKRGTIWAGSFGGGVQYFKDGRWTDAGVESLAKILVMSMHYDKNSDQLLVATNGNGVICINAAEKKTKQIKLPDDYNQWVSAIYLDTCGTLWIGTSSGLLYYNQQTRETQHISLDGIPINNPSAIRQDGDNILIGCEEGLLIYNINSKKQRLISDADGLACKAIRSITITKERIWLATRTNIASMEKDTYHIRNFSSFSGYEIGEFHRNSAVKPGKGYILFGGDNGIICFTPDLIIDRKMNIDHVFFTQLSTPLHTERLDANIFYAKSIELDHDNSSFTIDFASAEIGDPDRIHYDYLLEGHETQWHRDAVSHQANYSSLPAGDYVFRVRAYLEDNPTEYTENTIDISVAAPWYASTWAFIAYACFLLIIAYAVYQQMQIRKAQKELIRKSAERDRIKEAKLKLFTSITHELRSPLTMIESPLRQLMHEDSDADHQSLYSTMLRNCNRLLDLVKQITDIRKIDAGQLKLKLEEVDYVEYSEQIYEQFKGIAMVKRINFVIDNQEEELPVMIDPTHFEKVLSNILSNAFKFTPEGGTIKVSSQKEGNNAQLTFFNSGAHIAPNDISHLWERFYQGTSGNDRTGSGIGLNLVYELVKMHQGNIEARNVEPEGVEFVVTLPLNALPEVVVEDKDRKTVLLVDDDTELSSYVKSQLEKTYNVIIAFSGNAGWKAVLASRPDVVVTDYRMPDGNGMELSNKIKTTPDTAHIPVIMLTGEGDETLKLLSLNNYVDHYLEKPVNIMLLRSAISQVLRVLDNLRIKANLKDLMVDSESIESVNVEEKLFQRINDIIKKHIDNSDFSVMQLSEEVGMSRVHLSRKMKARYGVTTNIFIRIFRLKQAAYMLVYNKMTINEIASKCGFSSHSYFTTSFHEYYAMSPTEFASFYSLPENKDALDKLLEY